MRKILYLTLVFSLLLLNRAEIDLSKWELFANDTSQISIRGKTMARLLAYGENSVGFPIQVLNRKAQTWEQKSFRGTKIQMTFQELYYTPKGQAGLAYQDKGFFGGGGYDIGPTVFTVDNEGNFVYFVGRDYNNVPTNRVMKLDKESGVTATVYGPSQVASLAVEPISRRVWAVLTNGNVQRHTGDIYWVTRPGLANNITFGTTDDPYIVSKNKVASSKNYEIMKWNSDSENWDTIPGIEGTSVTLDDDDNIYVMTADQKVYRQRGKPSIYCPMCRESCTESECTNYEGYCTKTRDRCLNCLPGTFAVESPLRCESCPKGCEECSNATTCTRCSSNQYLTENGTCLDSCEPPLVSYESAGRIMCKGPCPNNVNEPLNIYYYPDGSCQPICGVLLENFTLYQSCDSCTKNCLICSNATHCSKCTTGYFLTPSGTCRASCPPPLISITNIADDLRCEGPCATEETKIYWNPVEKACQSTCNTPVSTCSLG